MGKVVKVTTRIPVVAGDLVIGYCELEIEDTSEKLWPASESYRYSKFETSAKFELSTEVLAKLFDAFINGLDYQLSIDAVPAKPMEEDNVSVGRG